MGKKQTSIYFEEEFIDAIKARGDKENLKMNDFVVYAVERQMLHPFFSWRHLQNYMNITRQGRFLKNEDVSRKAFFYIIAYDGILMEYIDQIYKIENRIENIKIPDDLADILHPDFDLMQAGMDIFSSGKIDNMEDALEWFYTDKNEMQIALNAFLIAKNIISIKDELYRFKQTSVFPVMDPKKEYSIHDFEESLIYKQCSDNGKKLLEGLLTFIRDKELLVNVRLGNKDPFTFTLNIANDKRLAIISLSDNISSLRIGINKLPSNAGGCITLCRTKYDLQELIYEDLMTKYKELTAHQ